MSKPTLLMNVGTAWSATSPLHYTLSLDHKYAHTGLCKENWYLYNLQENTNFAVKHNFKNCAILGDHILQVLNTFAKFDNILHRILHKT